MATSHCPNCGQSKTNYAAHYCDNCTSIQTEARKVFREANPDAPESDAIRAGKNALMQTAHSAHKNFIDPRLHSRVSGPVRTIAGR